MASSSNAGTPPNLSALESGGTLFRHGETFSGFLVPLVFRGALKRATERGFEAMNQALKLRAESKSSAQPLARADPTRQAPLGPSTAP
jgi:hypothetical protein